MESFSEDDVAAGTRAVRAAINASGYGAFVSDEQCRKLARAVLEAVRDARAAQPRD
jgi:hypothetical protein